jgi:hypothetical protein
MRRWYNYAFAVAVVALAAGVRVSTGQGYLEPSVTGTVRLCSAAEANRSLDVWLNNRDAAALTNSAGRSWSQAQREACRSAVTSGSR